ncbi:CIA machinery NADPH-dependent diflavin oxidoreductase Tah18 [Schizosaccharomyces pombe]|uniref:NADPH-dependent diflavin oxidoreductase 1 n=1 Tax=Schizosaccharomyces pombe (strain 972 / ATCC 24843) TaxID=284812 RepID=NDOR1_SCHPO|nr:putative NADPH-dependent diflavin oxidoreductase Tah18 [Schizosaccharomyces pombe]O94613.2 RecName: Full=NADPH-dependent diflavin oxidoreductase 1; AltName: Full=NADPH-dependent FMN and FAD-containing oxidoreductase [Schizosaccharomyces pombe 972h-]CAB36512.3 NADPH-dependent diflavin oxidoreductase, involved in iron-sulfur cluster assembly Tah18 (predicted) [Schizosaccharomyces pombe]|eukprot:NP_593046.2 putative NADPH-dependent diflavin oxidoreductase Tah18 [Schizosaccharomyces pombe]
MKNSHIYILYGSETGTAEGLAESLFRSLTRMGYDVLVNSMDDFNLENLLRPLQCVFICSTTGQGEMPLNMRKFWRFLLRKKLPNTFLNDMQYAVFGCGDTSYTRFNWASKKLDSRLRQLGAQSFSSRGEGDEQHPDGVEGVFAYWCNHLYSQLAAIKTPSRPAFGEFDLLPPSFQIIIDESLGCKVKGFEDNNIVRHSRGKIEATLVHNKRISNIKHWQDVRHLAFKIPNFERWKPGDVAVLYPWNDDMSVNSFIECMGWESIKYSPLIISSNVAERKLPWFPNILNVFNLVKYVLSIHSVPSRTFFEMASHFSNNKMHKERLQEFSSYKNIDDYYDYTTRPRRTVLETLQEFKSVQIPIEYALDAFPVIRGRQYSIANRCDNSTGILELAVALVKYQTILKSPRQGICSRWICDLHENTSFNIDILPGFLNLSYQSNKPLIMVGPGTGVAPLRALIQERIYNGLKENLLFFGCRNKSMDFLFEKDWEKYTEEGTLKLFCAFSRDQEKKKYVQHSIQENGELVYNLLNEKDGMFFVSGSSGKMPSSVKDAIAGIVSKYSGCSISDGYSFVTSLEKKNRYYQETW